MKVNDNVHEFHENKESKWLFVSDVHYDSAKCNRKMLTEHFDRCKEEGRKIVIIGDLCDAMGAKYDPRSRPADLRKEHINSKKPYFDCIVDDTAQFLSNYKDNIAVIFAGNHETNVTKRQETDLLARIIKGAGLSDDVLSQYWGMITVQMRTSKKHTKAFNFCCFHGYGGNAKRSKGFLNNQIDGFANPDANAILSGHTHMKWHDPSNVRRRLVGKRIVLENQHVFCCGSYKEASLDGHGYEAEKGYLPTRSGGWFIDLTAKSKNGIVDVQLKAEEAQ